MNWNYWLPWRDYPKNSNDETKLAEWNEETESKVDEQESCKHNRWSDWEEIKGGTERPILDANSNWYSSPTIEDGHLLFPILTEVSRNCLKCGKGSGARLQELGRGAIELDYRLGEGVKLSDALIEPVNEDADYVGTEDGRILVSESERDVE